MLDNPIAALRTFAARKRCSLLFLGPMSQNVVDVAIELANEFDFPLALIASRRQIEAHELGGGYVNGWSTESFTQYVRRRDVGGRIVLERDHGGPWQGGADAEHDMSLPDAMSAARLSYQVDIQCGIDILHIDPNRGPSGTVVDMGTFVERTVELLEFCVAVARASGRSRPLTFEIGSDEGVMASACPSEIEGMYASVRTHCKRLGIAPPLFMAIPTGTLVRERSNVGPLERSIAQHGDIDTGSSLACLLRVLHSKGALVKEHNGDYLSDAMLKWHGQSSIDAINVAPQLGVAESLCLVGVLRSHGLTRLLDRFIEIALASRKWERWLLPESVADDLERAIISGHYIFSSDSYRSLKEEAVDACVRRGLDLEQTLRCAVRREIIRQVQLLCLI